MFDVSWCLPPEAHSRVRYVATSPAGGSAPGKYLLVSQAEPNNNLEKGAVQITFTSAGKGVVSEIMVNNVDRDSCGWDVFFCRKKSQEQSLSTMMILSHMKKTLKEGNDVLTFSTFDVGKMRKNHFLTVKLKFRGKSADSSRGISAVTRIVSHALLGRYYTEVPQTMYSTQITSVW